MTNPREDQPVDEQNTDEGAAEDRAQAGDDNDAEQADGATDTSE